MIRNLLLIVFILSCSYSLPLVSGAENNASKAAANLLTVMGMEKAIEKNIESSLEAQMDQFAQLGLAEKGLQDLKAEMLSFMKEAMAYSELKPDLVEMYATAFTAEELNQLAEFYETPVGIKTMKIMPRLMAQGMELGQARVQARTPELKQRLAPIFEKYLPKNESSAE